MQKRIYSPKDHANNSNNFIKLILSFTEFEYKSRTRAGYIARNTLSGETRTENANSRTINFRVDCPFRIILIKNVAIRSQRICYTVRTYACKCILGFRSAKILGEKSFVYFLYHSPFINETNTYILLN